MAHNLHYNEQTGQHSFFSVKEKPWHGLGKMIHDYPTSAEALRYAQLDYTVEKSPVYTMNPADPTTAESPEHKHSIRVADHYATVRTDTGEVLGIVGKDYQVVQNIDAFLFFDSIVGGDGMQYETAGALGKGERIFITAKLPGYIRVGSADLIEQYLFLTTSHDGFGSITAAFTPVRIVCNNTLHAALRKQSQSIKIRHTSSARERLEQAHRVMGISSKLSEELEAIFNRWARVRITDQQVKQLIQRAMVPNKEVYQKLQAGTDDDLSTHFRNTVESVYTYAMSSPTQQQDTTRGTLFGAYNGITGYFQNVRCYKDGEAKVKSLFFGGTAQLRTQAAFDQCSVFAKLQYN